MVSLPCQPALSQKVGTRRRAMGVKWLRDLLVPLLVRIFLLSLSPERLPRWVEELSPPFARVRLSFLPQGPGKSLRGLPAYLPQERKLS